MLWNYEIIKVTKIISLRLVLKKESLKGYKVDQNDKNFVNNSMLNKRKRMLLTTV